MRSTVTALLLVLLCGSISTSAFAQSSGISRKFIDDEKALWSSPLRIKRGDVKWLAPISVGAAALLATDWRLSNAVRRNDDMRPTSRTISKFGTTYALLAGSGSVLAIGKLTHNDRAAHTGQLATEALLHTQLVVSGLKMLARRERPDKVLGHGEFMDGGASFPSGHTAGSFALARVIAHEYRGKPLVAVGAYGFATAVGLSRVGGLKHFPSDVLIGATIGELIGRYIIHRHASDR